MSKDNTGNTAPGFATGSFSYYFADRDPTTDEPDITPGYLEDSQLIFWQNCADGTLFYMTKPATAGQLAWAKFAFQASLKKGS